jgi:hypothetical protein
MTFGKVCGHLVHFSRLNQEKSGNPATKGSLDILKVDPWRH